eukprot:gene20454-27242_t
MEPEISSGAETDDQPGQSQELPKTADPRLASVGASQEQEGVAALSQQAYGRPSIWQSAVGHKIPDQAWDYHIRRSINDAAYNSLDYVPYASTMPVPQKCDNPKFMWRKK